MTEPVVNVRMSPQQRRIWDLAHSCFHESYRSVVAVETEARLEATRIDARLQALRAACEILRTTFGKVPGFTFPVQQIAEHGAGNLVVVADAGWSDEVLAARMQQWWRDVSPQLDITLVQRQQGSLLVLRAPAALADRISLRLIADYLLEEHQGEERGVATLSELQYANYASWRHEVLAGTEVEEGRRHWAQFALRDAAGLVSPFETDAPRDAAFQPSLVRVDWGRDGARQLAALAAATGSSPSVVALAVAATFANRHYDCSSLLLGLGIEGRSFPELASAIGAFHHFVPLRLEVDAARDFGAMVEACKAAFEAALDWQDSFAWQPTADVAPDEVAALPHLPLLFEYRARNPAPSGRKVSFEGSIGERFTVRLELACDDDTAQLNVWYDETRLAEAGARCLAEQLRILLSEIARRPTGLPLRAYNLHSGGAFVAVPPAAAVSGTSFSEMVRASADRIAGAIALRCGRDTMTYAELDARVDAVAAALQQKGVGRGDLVVLITERSMETMVALLGINRSGAAYLPVDRGTPPGRLAFIMEDSCAAAVTVARSVDVPAELFAAPLVCLDELTTTRTGRLCTATREPTDLTYAIYTSGSTGAPKAVLVEDQQCSHYLAAVRERLLLPSGGRFTLFTSLATDLGNTAVFLSLAVGGELDIIPETMTLDPGPLFEHLATFRPDVVKVVPSYISSLVGMPGGGVVLPDRILILGGEAPTRKLLDDIRCLSPRCAIFNHYGPTETTVGAVMRDIAADSAGFRLRPAVIGHPLARMQAAVLNDAGTECAAGEIGMLHLDGAGVARGYLNRPELTARRFHVGANGVRRYITGDRVRRLPSGDIEFVGRTDDQVKIRGYRVELKEVERALAQVDGVEQAVVLTEQHHDGSLAIVAFLQSSNPDAETVVRQTLEISLPPHLIPARITTLSRLPVTSNGKVDRRALAAWPTATVKRQSGEPPRTAAELRVATLWREILGTDGFDVRDNFFKRGGHSLAMLRLFTRLQEEFGREVPLSVLFHHPTIAAQAAAVSAAPVAGTGIPAAPMRDHYPLTAFERRIYSLQAVRPEATDYHLSAAFQLEGDFSMERATTALAAVTARHDALRSSYGLVDGVPVRRVASSVAPMWRVMESSGNASELLAAFVRPFDLAHEPLLRVGVFTSEGRPWLLAFDLHHLVADGMSLEILVDEFTRAYAGEQLEPPRLGFKDYACWENAPAGCAVRQNALRFWRDHLAGVPTRLDIRHDYPRPKFPSPAARQYPLRITAAQTAAIQRLAVAADGTPLSVTWAAFGVLLHCLSGAERVIVGTNAANRVAAGTSRLIGPFVNQLPVVTDLRGDPTFAALCRRCSDVLVQCLDWQMVAFDEVVEAAGVEIDPAFNALFQVKLTWATGAIEQFTLPGARAIRVESDTARARVDLQLNLCMAREEIRGVIDYRADLYRPETIARLAADFLVLLEAGTRDPDRSLSELRREFESRERERVAAERKRLEAAVATAVPAPRRRIAS